MKTNELVALLAASAEPIKPGAALRTLSLVWLLGLLVCAAFMVINLGLNPALMTSIQQSMFWVKLCFVLSLTMLLWWIVQRLAEPGNTASRQLLLLGVPCLSMWILALGQLQNATSVQATGLFWGETWQDCPRLIAELSLPVFVCMMLAMKQLAPTQLRLAGAMAGLLSGATAALVYCLHCPELGAPFLGTWYLLGMLVPGFVGALIGPHVLRW